MQLYIESITLRPKTGASSKSAAEAARVYHRGRIYIHPKGETIWENLEKRHNRPYDAYKKMVLPHLFMMLGLKDVKVGWSKTAGCGCGCSGGFVAKRDNDIPFDIHVTVTEQYVSHTKIEGHIGCR